MPVVAVTFDSNDGRSMLGFAASDENPDDVLVVARSHQVGAQESALGMDTYCLITGTSGATHFGGVSGLAWLERRRLRLSLDRAAAEALMLPTELDLLLPEDFVDMVRVELPLLLAG
jgi:hypothetical protein